MSRARSFGMTLLLCGAACSRREPSTGSAYPTPAASYWEPADAAPLDFAGPSVSEGGMVGVCAFDFAALQGVHLERLRLAGGLASYLELRMGTQRITAGWRCQEAAGPSEACERTYRALPAMGGDQWQLLIERAGSFRIADSPRTLVSELGTIDTLDEALLLAHAYGYSVACTMPLRSEPRADGWQFDVVSSRPGPSSDASPSPTVLHEAHRVQIESNGALRVLETRPFHGY